MHCATKTFAVARCLIAFLAASHLEAASSFAPDHSFCWGANIGGLNWRGDVEHGVEIDQFVCSGFIHAPNVGWINMGSGTPLNRVSYQNNSATDFGVNVSEHGDLSGLAYGANIGWISFAPIGRPRIDLNTGKLSGLAYGANIGWINLGPSAYTLQIEFLANGKDSDRDGIPDAWETAHTSNLTSLRANGDFDHDGHSDLEEYLADTDPTDPLDNSRILKFSLAAGRSLAVLTWSTRSTRQYIVQTRSSFGSIDEWKDAALGILSANGSSLSSEIPLEPSDAQHYFRIRAVRPLSPDWLVAA